MIFLPLKKFVIILNFLRPNIIKLWTKFDSKLGCSNLRLQLYLIFFLLIMNFDKSTIGRGGDTLWSRGSNEPLDSKYIYIYIYNIFLKKIILNPPQYKFAPFTMNLTPLFFKAQLKLPKKNKSKKKFWSLISEIKSP